ncbi:MAG TPA: YceI family protein [Terriglobales bacterium]|nr:YceI family protein [Terriglobales bacterium]
MSGTLRLGTLLLLGIAAGIGAAGQAAIDVEHSRIRIHVGKGGLFSAAGHEHWVQAPIVEGDLQEGPPATISFRVDSRQMKVEEDQSLSGEQRSEVESTMQTKVLESGQYPEIRFHSTSITQASPNTWDVRGDLSLHGQTRPVHTTVRKQENAYLGRCQIKQTDFGIQPVRVAGGMVRVKDELDIEFSVQPVSRAELAPPRRAPAPAR